MAKQQISNKSQHGSWDGVYGYKDPKKFHAGRLRPVPEHLDVLRRKWSDGLLGSLLEAHFVKRGNPLEVCSRALSEQEQARAQSHLFGIVHNDEYLADRLAILVPLVQHHLVWIKSKKPFSFNKRQEAEIATKGALRHLDKIIAYAKKFDKKERNLVEEDMGIDGGDAATLTGAFEENKVSNDAAASLWSDLQPQLSDADKQRIIDTINNIATRSTPVTENEVKYLNAVLSGNMLVPETVGGDKVKLAKKRNTLSSNVVGKTRSRSISEHPIDKLHGPDGTYRSVKRYAKDLKQPSNALEHT